MTDYLTIEKQDYQRRRRERYLIIALLIVISFLTYLGIWVFDIGMDLPFPSSILFLFLININVILLLLLLFLTFRNLVKLVFERKKNIMGAKLKTKLVMAFITLSLFPTIILFSVSVQFISVSIDYWFNLQIEQSLKNSVEVGQSFNERILEENLSLGNNLGRVISYEGFLLRSRKERLGRFIHDKQKEYRLASIKVFSKELALIVSFQDTKLDLSPFKGPSQEVLLNSFENGTDSRYKESSPHGNLISGIIPIFSRTQSKAVVGLLVLSKFVPGRFANRINAISRGLQEYRQLKMLKSPMKISHVIMLSIVTLLIIFSAVWFGFYLSKEITIPIMELAEGTKRIASGDYDFFIDMETKDEVGDLVNSFNQMTTDLKTSKNKLEEANLELVKSNFELEQRRLYMEIVLANVASGVISADVDGMILTINKSAERMLDVQADNITGTNYREILEPEYVRIISGFIQDEDLFKKGSFKKQIRFSVADKRLTILISLDILRDDRGNYLGIVAVLEDLSEIEKAQRMAAWREVARRIAHEVKNPLTPIQLSAQRLNKRYGERLAHDDGEIFKECTQMIIKQVDEIKCLVDEFSNFARMPASNPAPTNIREIINEAISLYKEAHKDIKLIFKDSEKVPVCNLDREQIKRAMINLLDNAIQAMDGKGKISVDLDYDQDHKIIHLEVADNGKGISPKDKAHLFEPYYSTKEQGTGLGLAIVNTIISDHDGFIRVKDNEPQGTRFIIELPLRV